MVVTKRLVMGAWLAAVWLAPVGAWAAGANANADTNISSTVPASNFGTATAINIGVGIAWADGVAKEWAHELQDPRQDIYTLEDGQPVNAPR